VNKCKGYDIDFPLNSFRGETLKHKFVNRIKGDKLLGFKQFKKKQFVGRKTLKSKSQDAG